MEVKYFSRIPEEELRGVAKTLQRNCDKLQTAFSNVISDNCSHIQGIAPVLSEKGEVVPLEIFIARHLAEICTQVSASESEEVDLNLSEFLRQVQLGTNQYLCGGCLTRFPGTSISRQSNCTYYPKDKDYRDNLPYFRQIEVYTGIPVIKGSEFYILSALGSSNIAVSIYPGVIRDILSSGKSKFDKWISNIRYYRGLTYGIIMSVESNEIGLDLWGNPQSCGMIEARLKGNSRLYIFNFV